MSKTRSLHKFAPPTSPRVFTAAACRTKISTPATFRIEHAASDGETDEFEYDVRVSLDGLSDATVTRSKKLPAMGKHT